MPRCYMVKKTNKYQTANESDLWDQKREPESPIEGAVAPRSYTALTNRPSKLSLANLTKRFMDLGVKKYIFDLLENFRKSNRFRDIQLFLLFLWKLH